MSLLAVMVAVVTAALAAIHLDWGFGGIWPGTDQKSCARAVAGFKGVDRMPPLAASFAVALALFAVALLPLALAGLIVLPLPAWLTRIAGVAAALVFVGRGVAGFTPAWRRLTPEMPFARNDRLYYSPLCLAIGAGLLLLALQGSAA